MKHQKFTLMLAVFALLVGSTLAQAQQKFVADIGFKFVAGTRAMAPGKYNIVRQPTGEITIRDVTGKASDEAGKSGSVLLPLTSLGRREVPHSELVFDMLPDGPHLAEVWFSGGMDGLLVLATKEPHKHQVLEVK